MRFELKEKFWGLGDDFVIRDSAGQDRYRVDGEIFSFGDDLTMWDMQGREVARIREEKFSWGVEYEITRPGKGLARVSKEQFTFFYCKYLVDGPGNEDYEFSGEFFDHEYKVMRGGRLVGQVSKKWFTASDRYGIDVDDAEDPVLLLATLIVIDLVCHGDK